MAESRWEREDRAIKQLKGVQLPTSVSAEGDLSSGHPGDVWSQFENVTRHLIGNLGIEREVILDTRFLDHSGEESGDELYLKMSFQIRIGSQDNRHVIYGNSIGEAHRVLGDRFALDQATTSILSIEPTQAALAFPFGRGPFEGGAPPEDIGIISEDDVRTFFNAYVEAALWSSTTDDGTPLDKNYTQQDLDPKLAAQMLRDSQKFLAENWLDIHEDLERAGHDFWLTRNNHGAGFWDGDWPPEVVERLSEASKKYGEVNLFADGDVVAGG